MKAERQGNKVTAALCLSFIIPLVFALGNYYFVQYTSGNVLCLLYYACTIMTLYFYCHFKVIIHQSGVCLFLFLVLYTIIIIITDEYELTYRTIFMVPIFLFSYVNAQIKDTTYRRIFLLFSITAVLVTALQTLLTLVQYPDAARTLASTSYAKYGSAKYRQMGAGGFEFIYSLVTLFPVSIVAMLRTHGKCKMLAVSGMLCIACTILSSGYMTAILLMILSCILFLCNKSKKTMYLTIIMLPVIIGVFILYRDFFAEQLIAISEACTSTAVKEHLVEIADIIAQNATAEDLDRVELYRKSVSSFIAHPLIGSYIADGSSAISGHSTLLDLLGGAGLLCFIPYVGFLITWYKNILHLLHDHLIRLGWTITSFTYVVLQAVNPIFASYLIIFSYMSIASSVLYACDKFYTCKIVKWGYTSD